jgi:hypothetical protein
MKVTKVMAVTMDGRIGSLPEAQPE